MCTISEWESTYIVSKVKERGTYMAQRKGRDQKSVPWRCLITSVPLWATIIHSLGNNWCIAFFFTQLPTYMRNVLGFSIKSQTLGNWRNAFWTCVAMYTLTTIVYLLFASVSVQPWNSLRGTWDVTTTHEDHHVVDKIEDNKEEETNSLQTSVS
ncbi:hypothetical protein Pmani_003565 [Petrolisthes manimaculis]|uniref:Uncharacterized protein n=1 Tax=Petrolisthes manimaculis TaxID=1843537 RepID=A0AAE1QFN4_9EUCA|nr:hypothetical protein Pmani_003565 [Petrolisthes manimaculis]